MLIAWILVCDAARARLFESSGEVPGLVEIACYTNSGLRGPPALVSAGRTVPRTQESMGAARHIIEPRTNLRDKEIQAFAHMLTVDLLHGHTHHRYERLFLVAPPHFLGILHEHLRQPMTAGFAGELPKDLVALPPAELLVRLQAHFSLHRQAQPARAT